jgi:hypothetical protein
MALIFPRSHAIKKSFWSGNSAQYGLRFDPHARVARYTQLVALKPYRGMNMPLRLILEGHRRFVAPGQFDYTWLLWMSYLAPELICRTVRPEYQPQLLDTPSIFY